MRSSLSICGIHGMVQFAIGIGASTVEMMGWNSDNPVFIADMWGEKTVFFILS